MKPFAIIFIYILALALVLVCDSWGLDPNDPALVGLWLFDDGKGDTVKDSSKNKNDGKFVGGFDWIDGKFGKAVLAKGGGSIDVQPSASLDSVTNAVTVAAWFRVDAPSDTGVRRQGAYLLEDQSAVEPIPDGFSFRVWTTQGITPGFYGTTKLKQGAWYHLAGTYDGSVAKMYVNGAPEPEALTAGGAKWDAKWGGKISPAGVLQLKYGPEPFTGGIDEVIIFSRALTDDEIKQLAKGWASVLAVEARGKLATRWGMVKAMRR